MRTTFTQITASTLATLTLAAMTGCTIDGATATVTGSGTMMKVDVTIDRCIKTPAVIQCGVNGRASTLTVADATVALQLLATGADPMILEIPAAAGIASTSFNWTIPGLPFPLPGGQLQVTGGLTSIPVDARTNLVAEPGMQLVIVDFPPIKDIEKISSASIAFIEIDLSHSPIKAMFAAKVAAGGTTYYVPLFPCVTDFSAVPAIPTSGGASLAQIAAALLAMPACDHKAYDVAGGATPPPASANYQGLWWVPNGAENFWGINFVHQGDQVYATWYTYDTSGNPWWLSMLAMRTSATSNVYTGDINVDSGPAFNAYVGKGRPTKVGTGTLTFTDATNGSFSYSVNAGMGAVSQTKSLTRYVLDATTAQPSCAYSTATPAFTSAANYQDLWWVANGAEDGWGINFAHQGNLLFATWYTYDSTGAPLWLSTLAQRVGASNVYTGALFRTSGPRYDAYDTTKAVPQQVGTATFTFADGDHATFDYSTSGTGGLPGVTQSKPITRFAFAASGGTLCQ